jgi:energy-coupling factor transport system ATP-binding protein
MMKPLPQCLIGINAMAETKNPAIRIAHLYHAWDSEYSSPPPYTLEDINLEIADNEFVAIIGQNGAGKTTLLKIICGLLRPFAGEICIRGKSICGLSVSSISSEVGLVMQNPDRQLFAATVYDEVSFALKNAALPGAEIARRSEAALAAVGLSGERETFPPALDRGNRAKVVIASVLAMGSKILLLDEPAATQDYRNSRRIMDIAAGLYQDGYTIVFVTHNMSLAAEYGRRIIVMKDSRVFMDGGREEIFTRTGELAKAHILPPPIFRLSRELRDKMPLEQDALSAGELAGMLIGLKRRNGA